MREWMMRNHKDGFWYVMEAIGWAAILVSKMTRRS